jgi:LysR family glycine cleavage system transcriptional activator
MSRLLSSLPPLASLRAFDAVARFGSVKHASESLHLTPSAISHQIRALETHFGLQLLRRNGRNVALTETGELYARAIMRGFNELLRASDLLDARRRDKVIRVSVTPTFATLAALPHIGKFRAAHRDFELRIEARNTAVDLEWDLLDAAVQVGEAPFEDLGAQRLLQSRLIPCIAPALLAKSGSRLKAGDLAKMPLIEFAAAPGIWRAWFEQNAPGQAEIEPELLGDSLLVALQMAVAGMGVLLAPFPLVSPMVANGSLKALTQWGAMRNSMRDFYFTYRKADGSSEKIKAVQKWLKLVVKQLEAESAKLGI